MSTPSAPATRRGELAAFFRHYGTALGLTVTVVLAALAGGYRLGLDTGEQNERFYETLHNAGLEVTLDHMKTAAERLDRDLAVFAENRVLRAENSALKDRQRSFAVLQTENKDLRSQLTGLMGDARTISLPQGKAIDVSSLLPGVLLAVTSISSSSIELKLKGELASWVPGDSASFSAEHDQKICQLSLRNIDTAAEISVANFDFVCRKK